MHAKMTNKILQMDKRMIDSAGQFLGRSRQPVERGYGRMDAGQYDKNEYIFGASPVAALYRREMLEDIAVNDEYFDEDYHSFYEDLDLNWRANLLGWKTCYVPQAIAHHQRGGTARTEKPRFKFLERFGFCYLKRELKAHLIKNRYLTMIKNDTLGGGLLNLPFILLYELKLWGYALLFEPYLIIDTIKNFKYFKIAYKKRKVLWSKVKKRRRESARR